MAENMAGNREVQRRALVTGAGSGLGRAMVQALAAAGVDVVLHYHTNRAAVASLAADLGGSSPPIVQADLASPTGPSALCRAAEAAAGAIDILVNNAGDWVEGPLLQSRDTEWDRLLQTDLRSTYLMIRTLAPRMIERGWGRIVNVSSIASLNYIPGEGLYGVAKAGVNMLTKAFGVELAGHGVTVNAVAPGWTLPADQPFPRAEDYPQCAAVPDGRPGHAREVAALVRFLASDAAAHITGQILPVDGGHSATLPKGR